jgi:hypothetical protein
VVQVTRGVQASGYPLRQAAGLSQTASLHGREGAWWAMMDGGPMLGQSGSTVVCGLQPRRPAPTSMTTASNWALSKRVWLEPLLLDTESSHATCGVLRHVTLRSWRGWVVPASLRSARAAHNRALCAVRRDAQELSSRRLCAC